jgi:hypothetical protein
MSVGNSTGQHMDDLRQGLRLQLTEAFLRKNNHPCILVQVKSFESARGPFPNQVVSSPNLGPANIVALKRWRYGEYPQTLESCQIFRIRSLKT